MKKKKVILIVDDEEFVRVGMAAMLEKRSGYDVLHARNGKEGVECTEKHKPDLIISDYDMPVMNGVEMFVKLYKELPTLPPVIFASSLGSGWLRDILRHRLPNLRDEDMPMVLTKPVDAGQLLTFVRGMLGEE